MVRTHVLAALFFIALSVLMTWPLATALDRAVAYPGDPFINTWILDWDWYATLHQPLSRHRERQQYTKGPGLRPEAIEKTRAAFLIRSSVERKFNFS